MGNAQRKLFKGFSLQCLNRQDCHLNGGFLFEFSQKPVKFGLNRLINDPGKIYDGGGRQRRASKSYNRVATPPMPL